MEHDEFIGVLTSEGFEEILTLERQPNIFLDVHTHPFEAKALILAGEIRLRVGEIEQVCQAGHVFQVPANAPHSETYGPEGARYVVGRKSAATITNSKST